MLRRFRQRAQIEKSRDRLYRLAWSWTHDDALADDLTQAALLKALARIEQLRDDQRLDAWLSRILANVFRDYLRAQKDIVDIDDCPVADEHHGPRDECEEHELIQDVRAAVAALKPEFRMVITMVDLMDMSYAEVATALDIPTGTVMSRVSRGRAYVKKHLSANVTDLQAARSHLRAVQ